MNFKNFHNNGSNIFTILTEETEETEEKKVIAIIEIDRSKRYSDIFEIEDKTYMHYRINAVDNIIAVKELKINDAAKETYHYNNVAYCPYCNFKFAINDYEGELKCSLCKSKIKIEKRVVILLPYIFINNVTIPVKKVRISKF